MQGSLCSLYSNCKLTTAASASAAAAATSATATTETASASTAAEASSAAKTAEETGETKAETTSKSKKKPFVIRIIHLLFPGNRLCCLEIPNIQILKFMVKIIHLHYLPHKLASGSHPLKSS
jgi:hypothetical protein